MSKYTVKLNIADKCKELSGTSLCPGEPAVILTKDYAKDYAKSSDIDIGVGSIDGNVMILGKGMWSAGSNFTVRRLLPGESVTITAE